MYIDHKLVFHNTLSRPYDLALDLFAQYLIRVFRNSNVFKGTLLISLICSLETSCCFSLSESTQGNLCKDCPSKTNYLANAHFWSGRLVSRVCTVVGWGRVTWHVLKFI